MNIDSKLRDVPLSSCFREACLARVFSPLPLAAVVGGGDVRPGAGVSKSRLFHGFPGRKGRWVCRAAARPGRREPCQGWLRRALQFPCHLLARRSLPLPPPPRSGFRSRFWFCLSSLWKWRPRESQRRLRSASPADRQLGYPHAADASASRAEAVVGLD